MESKERIEWLDGLKGIACLLIFVHHFCLAFYPSIHYGNSVISHFNGIDTALADSPLSVILNGNFLVAIFCVISGILISNQVMSIADKTKLSDVIVKRYFRLMLPLFPIGILVYVMLRFEIFTNIDAATYTQSPWLMQYYNNKIGFIQTLKLIFIDTWFYGSDILSNAFWMLSQLFYGTFLSIVLSIITWKSNKNTWLIYVVIAFFFLGKQDLSLAFILGTLLSWLYKNKSKIFNKYLGCILLTVGLLLGGYPSGIIPNNIYKFLNGESYLFWHIIGSFLTIYGIWSCSIFKKILSMRIFKLLGKISYSVYLIHIPILFSVSTGIFLLLINQLGYTQSVFISLILSGFILIVISCIYNKYIEKASLFLQMKILTWFIY